MGLLAGALWFRPPVKPPATAAPAIELSGGTKAVLDHLDAPVEVRFYSLLDPGAPEALRTFSERVDRFLSAYQQQSKGRIAVTRFGSETNATPNAALADGINGFNLDKGEGCFLGIALSSKGKKEVLPQLSPDWEPALESDVSRAILRLSQVTASGAATVTVPENNAAIVEQVKHAVPNFASISLEEGSRTLRQAALKEFSAAVSQMQAQMQEAQQRLEQARNGGSAADQESAMKHLQEVQLAQSEKLAEVAAQSQAQIDAFKQLKAGAN
jgi:hypothetical protein